MAPASGDGGAAQAAAADNRQRTGGGKQPDGADNSAAVSTTSADCVGGQGALGRGHWAGGPGVGGHPPGATSSMSGERGYHEGIMSGERWG